MSAVPATCTGHLPSRAEPWGDGGWPYGGTTGTEVGVPQALAAAVCLDVPGTDQRQYPLLALVVSQSQPLKFYVFSCKTQ